MRDDGAACATRSLQPRFVHASAQLNNRLPPAGSNYMHIHMRKTATGHEHVTVALTEAADSSGDSASSDAYGASTPADADRPPSFMMAHGAMRCPNSTYNNTINRISDL